MRIRIFILKPLPATHMVLIAFYHIHCNNSTIHALNQAYFPGLFVSYRRFKRSTSETGGFHKG